MDQIVQVHCEYNNVVLIIHRAHLIALIQIFSWRGSGLSIVQSWGCGPIAAMQGLELSTNIWSKKMWRNIPVWQNTVSSHSPMKLTNTDSHKIKGITGALEFLRTMDIISFST